MAKRLRWNNIIKLVLTLALVYIVIFHYQGLVETFAGINEESSEIIARNFILNSATYMYDGKDLEIRNIENLECRNCWAFNYEFKTDHVGYGDRSGKDLDLITEGHKIRVVVNNREITSAVIDEYWDEINQKVIE
jgi:hypothetical protein